MLLAIDPGPEKSAWVIMDEETGKLLRFAIEDNNSFISGIRVQQTPSFKNIDHVAIEMIASYGMPVGAEVFDTCVWIGRFFEALGTGVPLFRKDVKLHLCGNPRAKDGNVRQAIIDKFPRTGGGKKPQIGTKSKPGPLYGVANDVWAALGVAIYYRETKLLTTQ